MSWYTVSIIISCRLKGYDQGVFPVYENFTLFEADSSKQAYEKAKKYAEEYVAIDDNLRLNGKPAYWKFEGIRKIIEIRDHLSDELDVDLPHNGVEVSYSYMEVNSEQELMKLANGDAVVIKYIDAADDWGEK